jgi:FK506-binding protein 4/5
MKKGEKCILKIRYDYGYGKNGSPPKIPGGATLLFEVELLHFSNEVDVTYGKKTVLKRTMVDGEDWKTPSDFAKVTVKYTFAPALPPYSELASNEGREEGPGDVFVLGEDEAFPGFETAVRSMKKGEQATFTIDASEATPSPLCKIKGLPTPGVSLKGTMHLVDFANEKELYEMSSEEKLETAERFKALGNTAFKDSRLANALNKYEHARNLARSIRTPTDDDEDDPAVNAQAKAHKAAGNALTVVLHCNIAAVHLKLKDYAAAKEACDEALKMDAKCVKALLRRAQARRLKGEHEHAVRDCDALLALEPDNKEAKDLKALSQKEAAAAQKKMDSMYSKMFGALGGN